MDFSSHGRSNGRAANELRPFGVQWDPMGFALSSLIVRTGNTSVICSVSIEDGVPRWMEGQGKGWLTAEYRLLPGSTPQRQNRELLKLSGRTQEIQRLIGRTLRAVIDFEVLGERTLMIDCDVIQADAGTRTASITGSWIAIHRAFANLKSRGLLRDDPLKGQVAAVSVGLINGFAILDLDYHEDSKADVDLNIVMDSYGMFLEIQGTAERRPFSREQLLELMDLSEFGLKRLMDLQISALKDQA
tara:strand:- start:15 stop:749 length:735 start_codon:yes stop_codon:yes gene_type:complete